MRERYAPPWREHDRKLRRARNALNVVDEIEFSVEHLLVEKEQRAESLILGGCSDIPFDRQMGEKSGDFLLAHFVRMPLAMKENVTANPIDVGLFGADGVMFHAQMPADPIE